MYPIFTLPSAGSTVLYLIILAVAVGAFVFAHAKSAPGARGKRVRNAVLFAALWCAVTGLLPLATRAGIETATAIQTVTFILIFVGLAAATASGYGRRLAGLPVVFLVGVQAFRFPLELVLHQWWEDGFLPVQMTYTGDNLDIVTGLLAIPVAAIAWARPTIRWPVWVFNIIGLGLLIQIIAIVTLSNPTPLKAAFGGYPDLVPVPSVFPYVWLATVIVPVAFLFHFVLFRRLWADRAA